jgi:hypothetical protein
VTGRKRKAKSGGEANSRQQPLRGSDPWKRKKGDGGLFAWAVTGQAKIVAGPDRGSTILSIRGGWQVFHPACLTPPFCFVIGDLEEHFPGFALTAPILQENRYPHSTQPICLWSYIHCPIALYPALLTLGMPG